MSKSISCTSCGAANVYEDGQSNVKCEFCSNLISTPSIKRKSIQTEHVSRIKSKPHIVPPKEKKISTVPNFSELHNKVRVDDGWIVHFKNRPSKFFRDDIESDYSGGAGLLKVTNKGLISISELADWFSDTELEMVRFLDVSNNKINDLSDLALFPNVMEINLSNNEVSVINVNDTFNYLIKIDLSGNPLNKIESFFEVPQTSVEKSIILNDAEIKITNEQVYKQIISFTYGGLTLTTDSESVSNISSKVFDFFKLNPALLEKNFIIISLKVNTLINLKALNWDNISTNSYFKRFFLRIHRPVKCDKCGLPMTVKAKKAKRGVCHECGNKSFCFIATAAMGSYDDPQVMELRYFRDEWILTKNWGESFVKWYYHYGEKAAKVIDKSFVLKKFSYLLIVKPLVYLSRIVKK